jgi:hypothetical protein
MRRNATNRLEFRFLGIGGSATGRWETVAFVLLEICAMAVLAYLLTTDPLFRFRIGGLDTLSLAVTLDVIPGEDRSQCERSEGRGAR